MEKTERERYLEAALDQAISLAGIKLRGEGVLVPAQSEFTNSGGVVELARYLGERLGVGDGPAFKHEILVQPHEQGDGVTTLVQVDVEGPGRIFIDITEQVEWLASQMTKRDREQLRGRLTEVLRGSQ